MVYNDFTRISDDMCSTHFSFKGAACSRNPHSLPAASRMACTRLDIGSIQTCKLRTANCDGGTAETPAAPRRPIGIRRSETLCPICASPHPHSTSESLWLHRIFRHWTSHPASPRMRLGMLDTAMLAPWVLRGAWKPPSIDCCLGAESHLVQPASRFRKVRECSVLPEEILYKLLRSPSY